MKKQAKWIKIYHSYQTEIANYELCRISILENIDRNYKSLNLAIRNEFKSWTGCGEVIISSISAGPFDSDEKWGQKMSLKFKNKKIKFNN